MTDPTATIADPQQPTRRNQMSERQTTATIQETAGGWQIRADLGDGRQSNGATFVTRQRAEEALRLANMQLRTYHSDALGTVTIPED